MHQSSITKVPFNVILILTNTKPSSAHDDCYSIYSFQPKFRIDAKGKNNFKGENTNNILPKCGLQNRSQRISQTNRKDQLPIKRYIYTTQPPLN